MSFSMKCYSSRHDWMSCCLMACLCTSGELSRRSKCYLSRLSYLLLPLLITLLDIGPVSAGKLQTTTMSALETVDQIAVSGYRAFLPCDLTPPNPSEVVYLVLWYKGEEGEPIYSYDARHGTWNLGARWSDDQQFGTRAYFQLSSSPAELRVENIKEHEAGLYRCRVDFKSAPTRNSLVNLTVLVPPSSLNIIDSNGQEIKNLVGPYQVASITRLRCLSSGGDPSPEVTWWKENRLIDNSFEMTFTNVIQNTLEIGPLARADLGTVLTCQSSNNNISIPLSYKVEIDMVFAPIDVSITSLGQPLSAGTEYSIECEAAGSRPDPVITWWLGDTFLGHNNQVVEKIGNISKSVLKFTPKHQDDQKVLTCRAENTEIKDGAIQDSWKLTVYYPPIVSLRLGLELGSDAIDEGKDVYFECKIKANPEIYKIRWTHNGKHIDQKATNGNSGLIMSGQSLVLQKVKREQAGNFTCLVSNLEGDTESNSVLLKILYAPRCIQNEKQTHGANIGSNLEVKCTVDSYPLPTSFSWGFNNSKDAIKISDDLYEMNESVSTLKYSTLSDHHFGHLYCWARNSMGVMSEPCIFNIIPARPPAAPGNCVVLNQTTDVLQVECEPGFDGGLDQFFLLEVVDVVTTMMLANVSSSRPVFTITGLNPGRDLRLAIFAVNKNGKSRPTILEGFTTKVAQLQVETPVPIEFTPFLGILAGAVITLLLIAIVIILIIRCKYRERPNNQQPEPNMKTGIHNEADSQEYLPMSRPSDPDVISASKSRGTTGAPLGAYQRGEKEPIREINKHSGDTRTCELSSELSMISDENMWIRDAATPNHKKSVLNITVNPSESPDSWTPLLHHLNQESNL